MSALHVSCLAQATPTDLGLHSSLRKEVHKEIAHTAFPALSGASWGKSVGPRWRCVGVG